MTEQPAVLSEPRPHSTPMDIRELDPAADRAGILELLGEIYPRLEPQTLSGRLAVIATSGWRCAGGFLDGRLVALTGFWVQTRFYCGRYLYIDHFVVTRRLRSLGLGEQLLSHMHAVAVAEECEQTCLDTFISNEAAQRFWRRAGYTEVGLHFVRPATRLPAHPAPGEREEQT